MLLYFLGTGAGRPSPQRNVAGIAVRLPDTKGEVWLFDCGEGTQHQLLFSPFTLRKITRVFITHLHGDHIFGLPGLLASRSFSSKDQKLAVYGPAGIRQFLETALSLSSTRLSYPLEINEIEPGAELQISSWKVKVGSVNHGVASFGYRLEERDRPGRLNAEKLQEMGVAPGPVYGKLKSGKTVKLEDGRVLRGTDFVGPPRRGRHVAIIGDTRYSQAAIDLAKNADVLVHEATFAKALEDRAYEFYHSTTYQAARVASAAEVKTLILTHFSSRYRPGFYGKLLAEAKSVFPNTYLAEDHFYLEIRHGQPTGEA